MIHASLMTSQSLMVTIPHSGEKIPKQASWLNRLPETILMGDVDRFVDVLYEPTLKKLNIPFIKTEWHRYAGDLNRLATDVDASSVENHPTPEGPHVRGFHWVRSMENEILMPKPMTQTNHQELVELIFTPFHEQVNKLKQSLNIPVYHLDVHSMPSVGTAQHRDPSERRADIVISDQFGKSSNTKFRDLVIASYVIAGFKVGYNWPYYGGRITEAYGKPEQGHHTLQVELNRALYMDEKTKKLNVTHQKVQTQIETALNYIVKNLHSI
jgi:N-formylglutamate amidohydrolase